MHCVQNGSFLCIYCLRKFITKMQLKNHIKRRHQTCYEGRTLLNSALTSYYENGVKLFKCSNCDYAEKSLCNVYKHLRRKHFIEPLAKNPSTNEDYKCLICYAIYTNRHSFFKHIKRKHPNNSSNICRSILNTKSNIKCAAKDCNAKFAAYKFLREHVTASHGIVIDSQILEFTSYEEFVKWKDLTEISNIVSYVKNSNKKFKDGTIKQLFLCNRSGSFQSNGQGLKKLKSQGSNKINASCTSSLEVVVNTDGTIKLYYWKTHFGHELSLKHVVLNSKIRYHIADMLKNGSKSDEILSHMKDDICFSDGVQRHHLVNTQDLRNIRRDLIKTNKINNFKEIVTRCVSPEIELTKINNFNEDNCSANATDDLFLALNDNENDEINNKLPVQFEVIMSDEEDNENNIPLTFQNLFNLNLEENNDMLLNEIATDALPNDGATENNYQINTLDLDETNFMSTLLSETIHNNDLHLINTPLMKCFDQIESIQQLLPNCILNSEDEIKLQHSLNLILNFLKNKSKNV